MVARVEPKTAPDASELPALIDRMTALAAQLSERDGDAAALVGELSDALDDVRAVHERLARQAAQLERDATSQDVTERERRERAERDFVTNAAHELQTPLAAITSAIEVLQAGAKTRAADRDRFLGHIEDASRRLDRLTRALLVLARAETRDEPVRREVVAVAPLLRAVARDLPREREVEIRCEPDVAVIANRPLLEQAIANLGHNALKHTRGRVVLSGEHVGSRVAIRVHDSGQGIPPEARARVFDRFYRADDAAEGFGLGLAIVAAAVSALEGELAFATSEAGTTVTITLPAARIVET